MTNKNKHRTILSKKSEWRDYILKGKQVDQLKFKYLPNLKCFTFLFYIECSFLRLNELPFDVNNKLNLINLSIRGKRSFNVFVIFAMVCRDVQSKLLQLNFPVYKDTIFTNKIFFTLLHHIHVFQPF